jgi:negative regulator of flagellin synthesis FlgM
MKGVKVMRIEACSYIEQLYSSKKTIKTNGNQAVTGHDEVQISRTGQDYQIAKEAVAHAPDIREDKVAELKAKLEAGTYQVSSEDFAQKLLDHYNTGL